MHVDLLICVMVESKESLWFFPLCFPSERILSEEKAIFEDVVEDFSSIDSIKSRFEEWKNKHEDCYRNAYISLCLPKLFAPFIRLQLLDWNPFEVQLIPFLWTLWTKGSGNWSWQHHGVCWWRAPCCRAHSFTKEGSYCTCIWLTPFLSKSTWKPVFCFNLTVSSSMAEGWKCDHFDESYWAVIFIGNVFFYPVQGED